MWRVALFLFLGYAGCYHRCVCDCFPTLRSNKTNGRRWLMKTAASCFAPMVRAARVCIATLKLVYCTSTVFLGEADGGWRKGHRPESTRPRPPPNGRPRQPRQRYFVTASGMCDKLSLNRSPSPSMTESLSLSLRVSKTYVHTRGNVGPAVYEAVTRMTLIAGGL